MLALNITGRSFSGLLGTLDFDQVAPVGFLLLQKGVATLFGGTDFVLRLVPLVAGLASVPLMFHVVRAYGGRLSAFVALALFALSPRLVYYSSELKQYSTDVLVALTLLLLASKLLADKTGPRSFLALGVVASLAPWISHPSVFVAAAVLLTVSVALVLRRDARRLRWAAWAAAVCAASLGVCYVVSLRHLGANPDLADYWASALAPMPPWAHARWYWSALTGMLKNPAGLPVTWMTGATLLLGAVSLVLRQRRLALVLLSALLLTLAASALGKYPFDGRLLLFLVPVPLLLIGEFVERAWELLWKVNGHLARAVVVLLCLYFVHEPAAAAWRAATSRLGREEIKQVMAHVEENRGGADLVYVYSGAAPAFRFYAPMFGFGGGYRVGVPASLGKEQYLEDADRFLGAPRVWFVFSHYGWSWKVSDRTLMLRRLDAVGLRMDAFESVGASAYLYDLRERPPKEGAR
jgi:4-amino-4-deoxy-L-arabinose transferase-like glycosyltransferase